MVHAVNAAFAKDPIALFSHLFAQVQKAVPKDPNAMVLSSVGADGRPSSRVVLLKELDARGFTFYTNLESRKGRELLGQPYAALCFYWVTLEKQVRVEGPVERVSDTEADAYFASRARGSQLSAWASQQSATLPSREGLEERVRDLERKYEGKPIPRPRHWSGLRVVPERMEFWTSKPNRLHERVLYTRTTDGWSAGLLYP
jgi:pyridoxamine 5'-phosphate oxidase